MHKLDALTRILEAETFDGMLVFTRTKQATVELAEKLEARGFAAAPLNGDIPQPQRERTVARLKAGQIDILVATDVAARGLDVERIGHVVNYDVPYDTGILRASHRPHRPRGPQGRGHPVHRAARAQHAARHRARHAPGHRTDEPADRRCGQHAAHRQIQAADQRSHRARARPTSTGRCSSSWRPNPACRSSTSPRRSRSLSQGTTPLLLAAKPERARGRARRRCERRTREPRRRRDASRPATSERPRRAGRERRASAHEPRRGRSRADGNFSHRSRVGTWDQARQHRRRHRQRGGHRGRAHRAGGYPRGSQLRGLAGRHAEADIQGLAEGARRGPRAAHQPGQREAAETAARDAGTP